ncbi:acetyl esterase/lipase [Weissella uvarum]|uniref:alpha/beta hydrolase n=1 Tax=Weissella uvarum TaxID=1479233 RepID=UPI001961CCE8|nr:alpha/beta hydrolase [Weissella uvarum]MBM7616593.1 acetyl esterase/lipase [Weissella uvarum]MCM0594948.1 alpha/beta hydrolase [Weissella uvarum]
MPISATARALNQKLKETKYRQELMNNFAQTYEQPIDERPLDDTFPQSVQREQYYLDERLVQRLTLTDTIKGELFMIHGGGFVMERSLAFNRIVTAFLKMGYAVTVPDYPLAPDDTARIQGWTLQVYQNWVQQTTGSHFIFGDSAGANIALRLAFDIRDQGLARYSAMELLSLCPDRTFSATPEQRDADLVLDADQMQQMQEDVAFTPFDFMHETNYADLGQVRFDSGENEVSVPAVEQLAETMAQEPGNQVTCEIHSEMIHDFLMWQMLPEAKVALQAVDQYFMDNKH